MTKRPQIPIITIHQAKGSEFDYVFLAGLQEGTFPGFQAEKSGRLAEEARLFYVAMTRAKKQLFLSWSQTMYPVVVADHVRSLPSYQQFYPQHSAKVSAKCMMCVCLNMNTVFFINFCCYDKIVYIQAGM